MQAPYRKTNPYFANKLKNGVGFRDKTEFFSRSWLAQDKKLITKMIKKSEKKDVKEDKSMMKKMVKGKKSCR